VVVAVVVDGAVVHQVVLVVVELAKQAQQIHHLQEQRIQAVEAAAVVVNLQPEVVVVLELFYYNIQLMQHSQIQVADLHLQLHQYLEILLRQLLPVQAMFLGVN
jgi:hypothetical protein